MKPALTQNASSLIPSYIAEMLLVRRMNAIAYPAAIILPVWTYSLQNSNFSGADHFKRLGDSAYAKKAKS